MASVRKRRWTHKGVEKEAWIVEYTDTRGKRRIITEKSKKDADRRRWQIEAELDAGTHRAARDTKTVSDALDEWLERCEQRAHVKDAMRPRTVRQRRSLVETHIRPYFGRKLLTELTPRMVQEWLDDLAYSPEKQLSHAHLKHLLACLRLTMKMAFTAGYIGANVLVAGEIRVPGQRAVRREIPSKEEIRELLRLSGEVLGMGGVARYLRPLVYIAVFTGMRQGEIRALLWEDVDFDAGMIHVRRGADDQGRVDDTKTLAGRRSIPIAPVLAIELKKWKLASQARSKEGLVFVGNRGRMMQPACIQQSWARLQRRALPEVGAMPVKPYFPRAKYPFHSLRHVAASLFIETGLPPKRIQAIMGHSSINMTFDRYGHLFEDPDLVTAAMNKIGLDLAQ
jgi:integrase